MACRVQNTARLTVADWQDVRGLFAGFLFLLVSFGVATVVILIILHHPRVSVLPVVRPSLIREVDVGIFNVRTDFSARGAHEGKTVGFDLQTKLQPSLVLAAVRLVVDHCLVTVAMVRCLVDHCLVTVAMVRCLVDHCP